jgi:PAT family beta-lactamase induction signal transducer AmpG
MLRQAVAPLWLMGMSTLPFGFYWHSDRHLASAPRRATRPFIPFSKLLPLRPLYLAIGSVGAVFTTSLLLLHHTPATFGLAMIGESVFQSLAFATSTAIAFDIIGRNNPLAATQFSLFSTAAIVPTVYMQVIDGRAYNWRGIGGSFLIDASLSLIACALFSFIFFLLRRNRTPTVTPEVAVNTSA